MILVICISPLCNFFERHKSIFGLEMASEPVASLRIAGMQGRRREVPVEGRDNEPVDAQGQQRIQTMWEEQT